MEVTQEYDFDIDHIPGKTNVVIDALSRRADYEVYAAYLPPQHSPDTAILRMNAITKMQGDPILHTQVRSDMVNDTEYQHYLKETEKCTCPSHTAFFSMRPTDTADCIFR